MTLFSREPREARKILSISQGQRECWTNLGLTLCCSLSIHVLVNIDVPHACRSREGIQRRRDAWEGDNAGTGVLTGHYKVVGYTNGELVQWQELRKKIKLTGRFIHDKTHGHGTRDRVHRRSSTRSKLDSIFGFKIQSHVSHKPFRGSPMPF